MTETRGAERDFRGIGASGSPWSAAPIVAAYHRFLSGEQVSTQSVQFMRLATMEEITTFRQNAAKIAGAYKPPGQ